MAVSQLRARRKEAEQELPGVVPAGVRRRVPVAVVALLVAAGTALVFAVLWTNAGRRQPVLAVAAAVAAGEVVEPSDLVVVRVAADPGLQLVPAADQGSVVGQVARSALPVGSLLAPEQIGSGPALAAGSAVVGVSLTGGQVPTPTLRAGDRVRLVGTSGPEGMEAVAPVAAEGLVFGVERPADLPGRVVVSVEVAEAAVEDVARAAAADRVSLVLLPPAAPAVGGAG